MSAGSLTPQEAAQLAVAERGLGAGGDDYTAAFRAIELYEASRNGVQLTPEQAKAFEERVDVLLCLLDCGTQVEAERTEWRSMDLRINAGDFQPDALRQLATVLEHLATNLERFPS